MIVCGRCPPRVGAMARCAISGETCSLVARVRRIREILLVTGQALWRGIGEIAGDVALVAILDGVPHRKREEIMDHIGRVPSTSHGIVALDAIRGESIGDMVRRPGGLIIVLVAAEAIIPDTVELQRVAGGMTIRTTQVTMRTHQRETVLLVQFRDGVNDPIHRRVATRTIIPQAHPMDVGVAGCAIHRCGIEDQRCVARLAIHFRMGSFQWETRGVMLEDHRCCCSINQRLLHTRLALVLQDGSSGFDPDEGSVGPSRRTMALGAIDGEALPMRRLRSYPHCGKQQERDYL